MSGYAELFEAATDVWGERPQLLKTIEELAELQRAIARYLISVDFENTGDADKWNSEELLANILEETTDVEIMIGQLKAIFGNHMSVYEAIKTQKIQHLRSLLKLEGLEV